MNTGSRTRRGNTSGTIGVSWDRRRALWKAQIRHDGRQITIGRFTFFADAVRARAEAARRKARGLPPVQ